MKNKFKLLLYLFSIAVFTLSAFFTVIYLKVSNEAEGRIDRGVIDNIISSESPVYYDDEITPIGVFFDQIHSKYIQYNDIPKSYIKALIASEDGDFFNHPGFDIKSILRALVSNYKAGKVVQGGSTITQQTAKNIFKREKRTYISKLKELFQSLLLEKRYSKEEILEMYANQFFVTGFGKGLMISAEYFFDKDARDLDLVESAFIAGMVKGPNKYNPFTKNDEDEKNKALKDAKIRKDYVLKNMRKLEFITEDEYIEALNREVPFKEGKVTYQLNVIMDYIREQLESDYFRDILHKQGIDNIATSGIKIYTSISEEIQRGAIESIRHHLPSLDVLVSGYNKDLFPERYIRQTGAISRNSKSDLPFFCTVESINNDTKDPYLAVSWSDGHGNIDYEGFKGIGEAWLRWNKGSWAEFGRRNAPDFLDIFQEGDLIPVRYEKKSERDDAQKLLLGGIPDLEGGIIVLKKGMVKAMVGGYFNRHFNRASDAKRQLGSIFKPLVYTAALQLKWNSLDQLTNMPDVFGFENTFYIPRPDHEPKSDKVSMTWAGAKSENLATIWLLYHLTDRLNMSEFRQVVETVGLARGEEETYDAYVRRIRDKHGVIVNREALMEAAFEDAKKGIESDLIFSGNEESLDNVSRLHFNIDNEKLDTGNNPDFDISRLSFIRLRSLNIDMKKRFNQLTQLIETYNQNRNNILPDLKNSLRYFYYENGHENNNRIIYSQAFNSKLSENIKQITLEWIAKRIDSISSEDVWVDNLISSGVIDMIQSHINMRYKELLELNRYDLEVLYTVRDFKTLVNLLYIKDLAHKMGISTQLDPVLSFPLGSNSISILEAALAYNTIMNGSAYQINDANSQSMVPIIKKIVDREGETIWEYVPEPEEVLSDRVSSSVKEILRMVVENGTGRTAKDTIILSIDFENGKLDLPVPAFGKTGTANRFTNSSFAGFIPGLNENSGDFDTEEGYVIASYVGYDDNRPMKGPKITISGASGALPLWIDTSNAIVNSREYKRGIQIADLVFFTKPELPPSDYLQQVSVSLLNGLPQLDTEETSTDALYVYSDIESDGDEFLLGRDFEPIQGVDSDPKK